MVPMVGSSLELSVFSLQVFEDYFGLVSSLHFTKRQEEIRSMIIKL